jgi:ATP-dependent DNA helicase RecQ
MTGDPLAPARELLRSKFGYADFLPGQSEPLAAVLAGRDVLAVMPTGSGKSLLYQLPAAMDAGLVVVVSPLIALMRDQLRALADKNVPAVALHSAQDDAEAVAAKAALASGRARLLYLAPERLALEGTETLLRKNRVFLFAVDEAHCISHWGHEFRPDYRDLGAVARRLGAPVLAVTATAGPRTRDDIVRALFPRPPAIFLRSFARPNLALRFAPRRRWAAQIADFIGRSGESGIVYCGSRRKADALAADLSRLRLDALPYHAGLDAYTRAAHQDAFFARKGVVMVATIAFGMGVDKPDVRFVAHADLPTSIEGYYQEIGRAGRDGAPARALALFDHRELALRWRTPALAPEDEAAAGDYARRRAMARLCATPRCRFVALLAEFGETGAPCGRCDHCRGGPLAWPRRAGALVHGWRAAAESRLADIFSDAPADEGEPGPAPIADAAPAPPEATLPGESLTIIELRRLKALEAARRDLARRHGRPPRAIATDPALRALAMARPEHADDPLFDGVTAPEAFLAVLRRGDDD